MFIRPVSMLIVAAFLCEGVSGRSGENLEQNSAHPSRGFSAAALQSSGGAGRLYCFAVN